MHLVFLLEEKSMKVLLDTILPKLLPDGVTFKTIPHDGKSQLKKNAPILMKAYNHPNSRFIIIQDQDAKIVRC